jgi:hypothetical protein
MAGGNIKIQVIGNGRNVAILTNLDLIIFLRNKKVLTYQIVRENSFLACIMHFDKKEKKGLPKP